jgi:hypothetical protein
MALFRDVSYHLFLFFDPRPPRRDLVLPRAPFPQSFASLDIGAKCRLSDHYWQCRSRRVRWRPSSKSLSQLPNPGDGPLPSKNKQLPPRKKEPTIWDKKHYSRFQNRYNDIL